MAPCRLSASGSQACQQVFDFDYVNLNFFIHFNEEFDSRDLASRARENQAVLGLGLQLREKYLPSMHEALS